MEFWIKNLPIPPSANKMYEPTAHKQWKVGKSGKRYLGVNVGRRASDELILFQKKCEQFKLINQNNLVRICTDLYGLMESGYVFRVDTWYSFEKSRIFTKDGRPKQIDSDNRRKPMQDGLALILGIDDKWFFSGNTEKVYCNSKEEECSIIRIIPVKARSAAEILNLSAKEF